MTRSRPWPDADRQQLAALLADGATIMQCADVMGRTYNATRGMARILMLEDQAPPPSRWTEPMVEALRQFWAQGVSVRKIGKRLGVSGEAVSRAARRYELPARESLFCARPSVHDGATIGLDSAYEKSIRRRTIARGLALCTAADHNPGWQICKYEAAA